MKETLESYAPSRRSFVRTGAVAAGALAFGVPALSTTAAAKKSGRRPGTIPVFPSDVGDTGPIFYEVAQAGSAAYDFVKGPGKAPFGSGSVQFTLDSGDDRLFLYNYDWGTFDVESGTESNDGVPLADVTALSYSTYTNDDTLVPALKMEVDPTGPDVDGNNYATLNFEPYYNNTVVPGEWQTWDVLSPDTGAGVWLTGVSGNGSISDPATWDELLARFSDATIRFGFGVGVGSGWSAPAFEGHVDDLTIGVDGKTTRYNFESRGKGGT
jgi:hypothetical protein